MRELNMFDTLTSKEKNSHEAVGMKQYNTMLAMFMERISSYMYDALGIPKEWHYTKADLDEIYSWDEDTARRVWKKIEKRVLQPNCSGLNYRICPFCTKNDYDHRKSSPRQCYPACIKCGYGQRHGVCTETNSRKSEFQKILNTFKIDRVDICRTLSNSFYRNVIEDLSEKILLRKSENHHTFLHH